MFFVASKEGEKQFALKPMTAGPLLLFGSALRS